MGFFGRKTSWNWRYVPQTVRLGSSAVEADGVSAVKTSTWGLRQELGADLGAQTMAVESLR